MKRTVLMVVASGLALCVSLVAAGAAPKSPDKVRDALQLLAYVQADMASKLPNKSYDRLPHENEEFQEAAPALNDALANDPQGLRDEAATLLRKARAAAQEVADISNTRDDARIAAAVGEVDSSLRALEALFPPELRPVHGKLGRRPGGQPGGPPADIR